MKEGQSQESWRIQAAKYIERKSLAIGTGALFFAAVAAEVAPNLVWPALKVAALEGTQWLGARWYLGREKARQAVTAFKMEPEVQYSPKAQPI